MKRLVLLLLVCAACKSSSDAKPAPAADDTAQQAALPRTRQTNRVSPSLPDEGVEGSNRPSLPEDQPRRHHRGDWGGSDMTDEQRAAMMKERVDNMRSRMDTNGDGKVSYDELKNAQGRMHFDNPEEIDTNHDGDISADELQAAMKARRDAFRAQRQAQQQGSGAAPAQADPNATGP
jgi:hypothetical protein